MFQLKISGASGRTTPAASQNGQYALEQGRLWPNNLTQGRHEGWSYGPEQRLEAQVGAGFRRITSLLKLGALLHPRSSSHTCLQAAQGRHTESPAHTPSALIGKPCAARGLERVNPNKAASQVLGVVRATRLLIMGGTPRHAKVLVNHQPPVSFQNQCLAPRGSLFPWLWKEMGTNHLPKPSTSLAGRCQNLLEGSAGLCQVGAVCWGQNRASGRREKIKMEEALDHCHFP